MEQQSAKAEVKKLSAKHVVTAKNTTSEVRSLKTNLAVKRGRKVPAPVGKKKFNNCVVIPKSLLQF